MNKPIHIIIGSQMGAAEYVADELLAAMTDDNISVINHEHPQLAAIPQQNVVWLICTSTHGAGEFPDNIKGFVADLTRLQPDLSSVDYGIISLGDSQYDTFCQAGEDFQHLLTALGAHQRGEMLTIDAQDPTLPEDFALAWLPKWIQSLQ